MDSIKLMSASMIFILLSLSQNLLGQKIEGVSLPEEIDRLIVDKMEEGDIPGLSMVIINGDNQVIKNYGYADIDENIKVTPETLFEIGSNSKAFTALLVTELERNNRLDLNDNVSKYLPWFKTYFEDEAVEIKVRHLIHHTSGIPWSTISKIPATKAEDALEMTVRTLIGQELRNPPGEEYEYATINYDVLALIVQEITGQPFEKSMNEVIFDNLGLSYTSIGKPKNENLMSNGYKIGFFSPRDYEAPRFKGNNASGYVISNAIDMAKWLRFHMSEDSSGLNRSAQI
ncbi:MAG: serine hydrolase domain-containing protein, partial [Cyclobacteriaceae bacterium]